MKIGSVISVMTFKVNETKEETKLSLYILLTFVLFLTIYLTFFSI